MTRFDILDPATSILGKRFLEASAGTGKTFAIEHLFVRLLLETNVELSEILVVTFTRAATRELKMRIRAALEKRSEKKIQKALLQFDEAQIFTIHGFCQRILSEMAFEAGAGFELSQWTPEEEKEAFDLFLEQIFASGKYSTSQMESLLRSARQDLDALRQTTLKSEPLELRDFNATLKVFNAALQNISPFSVAEAFAQAAKNYKRIIDPDYEEQARLIDVIVQKKEATSAELDSLLRFRQSFLKHTTASNCKVKGVPIAGLEQLHDTLFPLIDEASYYRKLQRRLASDFDTYRREKEVISPDDLLLRVQEALKTPSFLAQVQKRYRAVIIDEFQDTDPIQWEIFDTLFSQAPLEAFYLVGDPKQSIYAFRKADVYTFLEAGKKMGAQAHAFLDTNYRSEQGLVASLNDLFAGKEWMSLPKWNQTLSIPASKAAKEGDGHLQFLIGYEENEYFSFVVHEITRLQRPLEHIAILVKDRFQARRVQQFLNKWNIPSSQQRKEELTMIPLLRDFLEATLSPHDLNAVKKALLGPFADGLTRESFFTLHKDLLTIGFAAFYAPFLGKDETLDVIAEKLGKQPDSAQLLPMLDLFSKMGLEERLSSQCSGVQILTIHASKGLEFDTVFALGLAASNAARQEDSEEIEAEKMRQLYVAMTRAKSRLYVPLPLSCDGDSPIEQFWKKTSPDINRYSHVHLAKMEFNLSPWPARAETKFELPRSQISAPSYLFSFSALSQKKPSSKEIPENILPAGPETGVIMHKIFEQIFTRPVHDLVRAEIGGTPLEPWEKEIVTLVEKTLALPELLGLEKAPRITEMEFLFPHMGGVMKGFIDLCFEREGKYYIVDWKTNWLADYSTPSLEAEMENGDYFFQASIYANAMERYLKQKIGGALYVFVRGPAVYSFEPR
ncbi:MAG: UvrD-helicase domain-containing protein [Verrucomicrobia bacterium]|nr:UvrD-helicase domain-containing protein [Verrucomicrobiota bacterium]